MTGDYECGRRNPVTALVNRSIHFERFDYLDIKVRHGARRGWKLNEVRRLSSKDKRAEATGARCRNSEYSFGKLTLAIDNTICSTRDSFIAKRIY